MAFDLKKLFTDCMRKNFRAVIDNRNILTLNCKLSLGFRNTAPFKL